MKILTTVKKVVDVELTMHVEDGAIVEDGLQYVINAWDESAVEASVQLKENNGAETTLVSVGGGDNTDMIRRCYAMGFENGIHIDDPALDKADSSIFAKVLQMVFSSFITSRCMAMEPQIIMHPPFFNILAICSPSFFTRC